VVPVQVIPGVLLRTWREGVGGGGGGGGCAFGALSHALDV
jgi:hypothetical protein